jgi:hypothetical protein
VSDLDRAADEAQQAANSIAEHVCQLWMAAHTQGLRNGLEAAAQAIDGAARSAANRDDGFEAIPFDMATYVAALLAVMRDNIRLLALNVEPPNPASAGSDGD